MKYEIRKSVSSTFYLVFVEGLHIHQYCFRPDEIKKLISDLTKVVYLDSDVIRYESKNP